MSAGLFICPFSTERFTLKSKEIVFYKHISASVVYRQRAGLWYPSSWVQTRPKSSDFLGRKKILSTPSFGGEVKPSVPCRRFAACKRSLQLRGSRILDEIFRNISRPRRFPPSAATGLSRREGT